MAWDIAARRERPRLRTTEFRIDCMDRWVSKQQAQVSRYARGAGLQTTLSMLVDDMSLTDDESIALEALALQHADLILSHDMLYLDAVWSVKRDAMTIIALVRQRRMSDACFVALDEVIAGLGERVAELCASRTSLGSLCARAAR